jgi:predicted Fe-Mo cluster-binding NifX family protein
MKIAFPTLENQSYISHSASNLDEANFLTILDIENSAIVGIESLNKKNYCNNEDFVKCCKANHLEALVIPKGANFPLDALKTQGIKVYSSEESETIFRAYSDLVHNKLALA